MKKIFFYLILFLTFVLFPFGKEILASRPTIVISSYSTTPAEVVPGSEFDIEFTLKNQGDLDAKDVILTLESVSQSDNISVFKDSSQKTITNFTKQTEQKVKYHLFSEGSASTKILNVSLKIEFKDIDNQSYSQTQIVGVMFTGKKEEPVKVLDKPIILLKDYTLTPESINPGSEFDLELTLKNQGEIEARDLVLTLDNASQEGNISVFNDSNQKTISKMAVQEEQKVKYHLYSEGSSLVKILNLSLKIDFRDNNNQNYSQTQSFGILFAAKKEELAKAVEKPIILLKNYVLSSDKINPGDEFEMDFTLKNESDFSAKNILVSIGAASNISSGSVSESAPSNSFFEGMSFSNSSNLRIVKEIQSKKEKKVSFKISTSPKISSRIYNFEAKLTFENDKGTSFSSSQIISVPIFRESNLKISSLEFPETVKAGEEFDLISNLLNSSDFAIKLISLDIQGDDIQVTEGSSVVSSLDSGMEESIELKAKILKEGEKTVKVIVRFKGDLSEEQIEKEIKIRVENQIPENQVPVVEKEPLSLWQKIWNFLKGLFGLGTKSE